MPAKCESLSESDSFLAVLLRARIVLITEGRARVHLVSVYIETLLQWPREFYSGSHISPAFALCASLSLATFRVKSA